MRERLSYRMTANGTPGPQKGKITGCIIDNACAAKEDLTVTVSVDSFWNLPADVRSLDILVKLGLATAPKILPCHHQNRQIKVPQGNIARGLICNELAGVKAGLHWKS